MTSSFGSRGGAFVAGLRRSAFVRNVLTVMSGSALAQAFGFALSPVISRLFTPAEFGVFGAFLAVSSVVGGFATLDYSQAVMLPKKRDEAAQLLLLSCVSTLAVASMCGVFGLLAPGLLRRMLSTSGGWIPALLVLAVFAAGLNASLQAWCIRVKEFGHTSASQVVRGVTSNGLQVAMGLGRAGGLGLVVSAVCADFVASMNLLRLARADLFAALRVADLNHLRRLAHDYRDFPLYSATQNLLNAVSAGLPVLLLAHFYGVSVAGAYAFGLRLINAPMSLVFSAVRQVLFQKAGEMHHQDQKLAPLFLKSTVGLFLLGLPPVLVLMVWAPPLFAYVFGEEWRTAGGFARYLALWLLFAFCNLPAVLFARLIRIQRPLFVFNTILLAVRVLSLVAGGLFLSALQTVAVFSVVGAIMNMALIGIVAGSLTKHEGRFAWPRFRI